jgi:hypothetical protein
VYLPPFCESPNQLALSGFEHPFDRELDKSNRWVLLSHLILWDEINSVYNKAAGISNIGRPGLNPRIVLGSLMIKHLCHLDDPVCGYPRAVGSGNHQAINEKIVSLKRGMEEKRKAEKSNPATENSEQSQGENSESESSTLAASEPANSIENKGTVIFDATSCPQEIGYPADLDLLSEVRQVTFRVAYLISNLFFCIFSISFNGYL